MNATGFAHENSSQVIDVRTVSPTKVGAMVNALWCVYKFTVFNTATDDDIAKAYRLQSRVDGGNIVRVELRSLGYAP